VAFRVEPVSFRKTVDACADLLFVDDFLILSCLSQPILVEVKGCRLGAAVIDIDQAGALISFIFAVANNHTIAIVVEAHSIRVLYLILVDLSIDQQIPTHYRAFAFFLVTSYHEDNLAAVFSISTVDVHNLRIIFPAKLFKIKEWLREHTSETVAVTNFFDLDLPELDI
jgi:hypothetical protein